MKLSELVGMKLESYEIVKMTEVFRINDDGRRMSAIGYFTSPHIAEVFAGTQSGGTNYNQTREVLVLTDGHIAFLVTDDFQIEVFQDEKEILRLKEVALSKLTPAERKLLGL